MKKYLWYKGVFEIKMFVWRCEGMPHDMFVGLAKLYWMMRFAPMFQRREWEVGRAVRCCYLKQYREILCYCAFVKKPLKGQFFRTIFERGSTLFVWSITNMHWLHTRNESVTNMMQIRNDICSIIKRPEVPFAWQEFQRLLQRTVESY